MFHKSVAKQADEIWLRTAFWRYRTARLITNFRNRILPAEHFLRAGDDVVDGETELFEDDFVRR
jgi:hypothetical protein